MTRISWYHWITKPIDQMEGVGMRIFRWGVAVVAASLFLTACAGPAKQELAIYEGTALNELFYKNYVMRGVADPTVMLAENGRYYLVGTSAFDGFKIWPSDNMTRWDTSSVALANADCKWGDFHFWAPEVYSHGGKYYMAFSAVSNSRGHACIGLAVADAPEGPYRDLGQPFYDPGYAVIDAHLFFDDDGQTYLFYSRDCAQNVVNGRPESHSYAIRVKPDLSGTTGEAVLVAKPTEPYEFYSGNTRWCEGPYVLKHEGTYYLMYSTNFYAGKEYSVCYATSDNVMGPYTKAAENPVLSYATNVQGKIFVSGPGHNSVVTTADGKDRFMVYHTHTSPQAPSGDRDTAIDRMGFREDGSLFVSGPTLGYQARPSGTTEAENLAPQAQIKRGDEILDASLTDWEFAVALKKAQNELTVAKGDVITLTFPEEKELRAVQLYPGGSKKVGGTVNITIDNRYTITGLTLPKCTDEAGASALAAFDAVKGKTIRIEFTELEEDKPETSLSEIVVLGR